MGASVGSSAWLDAIMVAALSGGGTVPAAAGGWSLPAAAGGWSLPSSFGLDKTLSDLTPGEMVLPTDLSAGIKNMIRGGTGGADGAGGGDMHLHFHGPSDGPAVERWFSGLMARNPRVVANMLRSNALTPRSW